MLGYVAELAPVRKHTESATILLQQQRRKTFGKRMTYAVKGKLDRLMYLARYVWFALRRRLLRKDAATAS